MSVRPNDQQLAGIAPKTIKYTRATCAGCASLFFKSRCATFGVLGRVCRKAFSGVFIYVVYKGAFSKKK